MLNKIKKNKIHILTAFFLILFSGITHSYNMFNFPYYENDEGVYMSQAWAILELNELAPYTYWYDHAPGGWIFIALWIKLIGSFFTFGTSVNTGRVFMLLIHIISSVILYYLSVKITKKRLAGVIAVIIFSLSPLGIYFQRRVLLDNMMIFWVLLSLVIILKNNLKLSETLISAIFFGFAVLTKENSIFFFPAFLYVVYIKSDKKNRSFSIFLWSVVSLLIISFYFVYALFKKEFFPPGFFGTNAEHVSLLNSMRLQLSRGTESAPFWQQGSIFYINLEEWLKRDAFTIVSGAFATVLSLLIGIKYKFIRIPAIFSSLFWAFLLRGSLVLDFYIVPLIPLLALNVGIVISYIINALISRSNLKNYAAATTIFLIVFLLISPTTEHYTRNETASQIKAISWIKNNLEEDDHIVIDNSIWIDLQDERFPGDKKFPNADWSWKVEKDNEIYMEKLNENWRNIEYIALSHEILKQIRDDEFGFIEKAYNNSDRLTIWKDGSKAFIDFENNISTNGDWMAIYQVKDDENIVLHSSWNYYKNNFIHSYGQIIDPVSGNTSSEGQSYALLRAVWEDDKKTFDGVLNWTNDHLKHRTQDNLISWSWGKNDRGEEFLVDSASAADADLDIALALLFAHKRWGDQVYFTQASELIQDIWEHEVVEINNRYYLTAGSDSEEEEFVIVNPSYFSPAHYRIFANVDKSHDWDQLADDTYETLNEIEESMDVSYSLFPNWIVIAKESGSVHSAQPVRENADEYGYDAFRLAWRIALDKIWFNSEQADDVLIKLYQFYKNEMVNHYRVAAVYSIQGEPMVNFADLSTNTAVLVVFSIYDPQFAKNYYINHLEARYDFENGYWIQKDNYYNQNWAWFGTAFYKGKIDNLWGVNEIADNMDFSSY